MTRPRVLSVCDWALKSHSLPHRQVLSAIAHGDHPAHGWPAADPELLGGASASSVCKTHLRGQASRCALKQHWVPSAKQK